MPRKLAIALLVLASVASVGCEFDYWFTALVIEGFYPPGKWTEVICIDFDSSPFELRRDIATEIDIDHPTGVTSGPFPTKLQIELVAYDAAGEKIWSYRTKRLKVNAETGRIETTLPFTKDYVVPQGGRLCPRIKPFKQALSEGYKAGVLLEPQSE